MSGVAGWKTILPVFLGCLVLVAVSSAGGKRGGVTIVGQTHQTQPDSDEVKGSGRDNQKPSAGHQKDELALRPGLGELDSLIKGILGRYHESEMSDVKHHR